MFVYKVLVLKAYLIRKKYEKADSPARVIIYKRNNKFNPRSISNRVIKQSHLLFIYLKKIK